MIYSNMKNIAVFFAAVNPDRRSKKQIWRFIPLRATVPDAGIDMSDCPKSNCLKGKKMLA
jgi:hypothetical protein